MTAKEFFDLLATHPYLLMLFFLGLPLLSLLVAWISMGHASESPWKYFFTVLVYACTIPGVFAITLNIYLFVWERRSIFETDIYTQILPIVSMAITLFIIRKFVRFELIPGFGKLSGLIAMISGILILMWIIDKTHIIVFSYLPFSQVLIAFILLIIIVRLGWSKVFS
ncbi:MAG: hypothetical protein ABIV51_09800 [Saprospiraceae bacterium]